MAAWCVCLKFERHGGVAVPMQDQGGDGDPGQVFAEVGGGEGLHAAQSRGFAGLQADRDRVLALRFADLQHALGAEEIAGETVEERGAIRHQRGLLFLGLVGRQRTLRVVFGLHQERRHRGGEHHAAQAVLAFAADVARHLPPPSRSRTRVASRRSSSPSRRARSTVRVRSRTAFRLVERPKPRRSYGTHAVAGPAARAPAFPRRGRQRPTVDQHDWRRCPRCFDVQARLVCDMVVMGEPRSVKRVARVKHGGRRPTVRASAGNAVSTRFCDYLLMSNHVHLLVDADLAGTVSRMMQALGRRCSARGWGLRGKGWRATLCFPPIPAALRPGVCHDPIKEPAGTP